jgi:hypothetical protein
VTGWKRGLVKGGPEFFRGDGWQMLLTDPSMALRVGIFLRASLLARGTADSRIAIGLGEGGVESKQLALSGGEAFVLSGEALDKMTLYSNIAIRIPKATGPLSDWLAVAGDLCDSLISQWTMRQAGIVCVAIDPKEPGTEEVAQLLRRRVSKQAEAKALRGANWHAIREAVRQFEKTPWRTVLNGTADNLKGLSDARQQRVVRCQTT